MDASTHTIAALSTPPGRGALAVIRLTGDGAQGVFAGVIREKERFQKKPVRRIGVYTIVDCSNIHDNENCGCNTAIETVTACPPTSYDIAPADVIDEVTAVKYDAPRSFTGEEMVEVFCHGGDVIPQKILDRLFRQGARAAGKGEFSRRAFVNGKIGLLKAESIAGLIESQTETRLRSAQLAYQGKQFQALNRLKRGIINALADIESRIEFGEDDDVAESGAGLAAANRRGVESIIAELEEELRRGERVRAFDDGVTVALAGPANAGKSSLFNEILGYDRSIVHDRPGTTRDIVSERLIFEGVTVKLIDSAGIRDTEDAVERSGIERTRAAVEGAHVVVWVTSADEKLGDGERVEVLDIANENNGLPLTPSTRMGGNLFISALANLPPADNPDNPQNFSLPQNATAGANRVRSKAVEHSDNILIVINKTDIATPDAAEKKRFCEENSLKYVETSLTEKINRDNLFEALGAAIRAVADQTPVPQIIINERHRSIVESAVQDLRDCAANFDREEVAAHCLKSALGRLDEFLGHTAGDEVLDEIFGKFCIGK